MLTHEKVNLFRLTEEAMMRLCNPSALQLTEPDR